MKEFIDILNLINNGKIEEAEILLRESKEENGKYWYLTGLIAFFKGNEDVALHFLLKSLKDESIRKGLKINIKRTAAYILLSKKEYEKTIKLIEGIENKNVDDFFILFTANLFMNNYNKAREYLTKAYEKDRKKTRDLLLKLYQTYIKPSPEIDNEAKALFLKLIERLEVNS